jgi:ribosomal protein L37AE/L43A
MEIGYYDDSCRQCGREQTVSIESADQQTWNCHYCEWTNPVSEEA